VSPVPPDAVVEWKTGGSGGWWQRDWWGDVC